MPRAELLVTGNREEVAGLVRGTFAHGEWTGGPVEGMVYRTFLKRSRSFGLFPKVPVDVKIVPQEGQCRVVLRVGGSAARLVGFGFVLLFIAALVALAQDGWRSIGMNRAMGLMAIILGIVVSTVQCAELVIRCRSALKWSVLALQAEIKRRASGGGRGGH